MKIKKEITFLVIVLVGMLSACNMFKDEMTSSDVYVEGPKQVNGTWQLSTVSRNGTDISDAMDFSQFHLIMKEDGTYTMENYLPFIVKKSGTWKVDDEMYPFFLTFQEEGASTEVKSEITYPIIDGKRHITLTLSPGCSSNSYVYSFEKVD